MVKNNNLVYQDPIFSDIEFIKLKNVFSPLINWLFPKEA